VLSVEHEAQAPIVGREPELATVKDVVTRDTGALVLTGGPGIGKTTLWEAGLAVARERGTRLLIVRPSAAETRLPFAALIDLCDCVEAGALAGLPAPQRAALEVALLRSDPGAVPPEPGAIALGFLNMLRALADDGPLLLAIDDVPWLDAASADVLAFAARRLEREPVGFLLTKRPGRPVPLELALDRRGLERLEVGPLSLGATRRLLSERLGLSLSRPLLRKIVEATIGNPLFTLEVGRVLVEQGVPAGGEDIPVPDAVEDLLGTRVAGLDAGVRRLLLALALSNDVRVDELTALEGAAALEDAVDAGVVRVEGARVRVSHPLLAAAASKRSKPRERRELHRALAEVVADEQLRALHLARATDRPDPELAASLSEAADKASARGARDPAARLAEHALRLTPPQSPERDERLLTLAAYYERAGEKQHATDLLTPAVETLPSGSFRARAWLLLSDGAGPRTVWEVERYLDKALAESRDDPLIRAHVLSQKATNGVASSVARIPDAEAWALASLSASAGDRDGERRALYALGWARALGGASLDELCERSDALGDTSSYITVTPERVAGQRLVWRGELERARETLERLLALADERGEAMSYALMRLHVCELELRRGDWAAAERRLDEWAESSEGDLLIRPMYQRCRALLYAGLGDPEQTEHWAVDAIARAEAVGSRWDWLEAHRARGMAALLAREPERAAEILLAAWSHLEAERVGEPGVFPVAPELVEALADGGEVEQAQAVLHRLSARAERLAHPWGLATAKRCAAIIALAGSYEPGHALSLAEAAADYRRMGLAFDHARTLLSLGRAQRRVKQWGAAREALEGAVSAFDALGSGGWAQAARADLSRVGGRKPRATGELTPTEREVVELAAEGMANKEIAAGLKLAVHTVEVHLSRAYAKLGVRSRAQLANRLAEVPTGNPSEGNRL
jgi:DNA-binding CsgD family transcriptional regulator